MTEPAEREIDWIETEEIRDPGASAASPAMFLVWLALCVVLAAALLR